MRKSSACGKTTAFTSPDEIFCSQACAESGSQEAEPATGYYKVRRSRCNDQWLAWGALEPLRESGPVRELMEPVYAVFADTPGIAIADLQNEMETYHGPLKWVHQRSLWERLKAWRRKHLRTTNEFLEDMRADFAETFPRKCMICSGYRFLRDEGLRSAPTPDHDCIEKSTNGGLQ